MGGGEGRGAEKEKSGKKYLLDCDTMQTRDSESGRLAPISDAGSLPLLLVLMKQVSVYDIHLNLHCMVLHVLCALANAHGTASGARHTIGQPSLGAQTEGLAGLAGAQILQHVS